ncbi:hypothetical protein [Bacillus sp. BHET2]|nr:hypothetical protein [Bacillus sp. BHET2]
MIHRKMNTVFKLEENQVMIVSEIVTFPDFSYSNFNDINGNLLMICTG